jgi:hypothetical protein
MRILGEQEDRVLFKTIIFDNKEEKLEVSKQMSIEGWEDLENGLGALRVVFRKYIEGTWIKPQCQ